jgi:hypothetical protein
VQLGDVQDVARMGLRHARNEGVDLGGGNFQRTHDGHNGGLNGLLAAAACDAGRRTRTALTAGLFVAGARLTHKQRRDP